MPRAWFSRHRGKPSNHRLPVEVCVLALSIVRKRYVARNPEIDQPHRSHSRRFAQMLFSALVSAYRLDISQWAAIAWSRTATLPITHSRSWRDAAHLEPRSSPVARRAASVPTLSCKRFPGRA